MLFMYFTGMMLVVLSLASAYVSNSPNGAICFVSGLVMMCAAPFFRSRY